MTTDRIGSEWIDAGRYTVCAIVDERVYAVLYWSEGFAAQPPGVEALTSSGAGWFLMFADDPNEQLRLAAEGVEPVQRGLSADELARVTRTAVGPARAIIRKRLGIV